MKCDVSTYCKRVRVRFGLDRLLVLDTASGFFPQRAHYRRRFRVCRAVFQNQVHVIAAVFVCVREAGYVRAAHIGLAGG